MSGARPFGFVLHSGWGFAADALDGWAEALARQWPQAPQQVCERGYFGPAREPVLDAAVDWIGIGHSFGHALLRQKAGPWAGWVALHGFTRFCRRPGRPQGTPPRLLDAMRARLQSEPAAVLADFRRLCGSAAPLPEAPPRLQPLGDDLLALRELDLPPSALPTLALASRDDAVVPPALTEACFAAEAELHWRDGGHCAWLHAASEGVARVADWLARRSDDGAVR